MIRALLWDSPSYLKCVGNFRKGSLRERIGRYREPVRKVFEGSGLFLRRVFCETTVTMSVSKGSRV
jgi:hypothetical protein